MPIATLITSAALASEQLEAAYDLHKNDQARIMRALEVIKSTGKSIKTWRQEKTGGIQHNITLKAALLLPPRDWLYERCDRRFVQMLDQGAIEEVEALIAKSPPPDSPLWRAIGVQEIQAYLQGHINRDRAVELGQIATRRYAKRQYTWFRNQSPVDWKRIEQEINNKNINNFVTLFQ